MSSCSPSSPRSKWDEPRRAKRRARGQRLIASLLVALLALIGALELAVAAAPSDAPRDAPVLAPNIELPDPPRDFVTHDGGWVLFSYHPSVRGRVEPLIAQADSMRHDLATRLAQQVLPRVHVRIARTPAEMETLAPEGAPYPGYAAGVAYSRLGLVLLTLTPQYPRARHDLLEIFRHELAHVALYEAAGGRHLPRWFDEGFAVFASGETSAARLQTLWTATLADTLIPLKDLVHLFPADPTDVSIAYAQAADVVRFLVRREERHRFAGMISRIRQGQSFEQALESAYGTSVAMLEQEWREDVGKRYTFWPVLVSGTVVWVGIIGLFAFGWRRRRQRHHETLARWGREEALEDERRRLAAEMAQARVHIVLSPVAQQLQEAPMPPPVADADVPKVEHDGRWHTLH